MAAKASAGGGGAAVRRLLSELRQVASQAAEGVHVFPAPDDLKLWRALIEGPPDSPFHGGVFALSVVIPDDYPFKPPKIAFETPVYHCNVSDSGQICLDILQDKWNPSLSVSKCLEAVRIMLQNPDTDNSLRQWIAELTMAHQKSNGADTRYYDKAREAVARDASMTLANWRQQWGC
uniref:UBC core domain-containing protein n=1 Tax=Pyrodinium bahamense TaxID=73915 RepID=A0A7S0B6I3_9DINO